MYINYFNAIKQAINTNLTTIKTVDYYMDQYDRYEDINQKRLPAVYIEFENPTDWVTEGNGLQTADTTIKFHLVGFDMKDSPESILVLANTFHLKFQKRILMNGSAQLSTELVRTQSALKADVNQLKIIELSYDTTLFDESCIKTLTPVEVTLSVTPEVGT